MTAEESQHMYDYISEQLDECESERFAYWLRDEDLETVYNLVREWRSKCK